MNRNILPTIALLLLAFLSVGCNEATRETSSRPTRTPRPDRTERPSHYSLRLDYSKMGDYFYRGFVQIPRGMTLGPDGKIYVADWNGRHILVIGEDESLTDMGVWRDPYRWRKSGPHFVAFDSTGNLYVVSYGHILKVYPDGTTDDVTGHDAYLFGGIAIDDQDQVFYAERPKGEVFTISPDGERVVVASGLEDAEGMVFGQDGMLYIGQSSLNRVVRVDTETGIVEPFFSWESNLEVIFLAVDEEGDIWIRGWDTLFQVSPEGVEKPFRIGGEEFSGEIGDLHTSGGIAFDRSGQLWIASYSSKIMRLSDPVSGQADSWASLDIVFPGLEATEMAIDEQGDAVVRNSHADELWRIGRGGHVEVLLRNVRADEIDSLAFGPNGRLYIGTGIGEIVTMDEEGYQSHYADVHATSMAFASDGSLYAASPAGEEGGSEIVRITAADTFEVITDEIAGYRLGAGPLEAFTRAEINIDPAANEGVYIFDTTHNALLFLSADGSGDLIHRLDAPGFQRTAIAQDGTLYHITHTDFDLYAVDPDGGSHIVAYDLYGDPTELSFGPDGDWLYLAESGAIDIIPIR